MMLRKCGKSLISTACLSDKLDRMVESALQWICVHLSSLKSRCTVASGLLSDDVINRLKEWRVAGLISQDLFLPVLACQQGEST